MLQTDFFLGFRAICFILKCVKRQMINKSEAPKRNGYLKILAKCLHFN